MERKVFIDPDALLTPNKTADALRELSGNRCGPSSKRIRKAIARGELRAKREGRWAWVRWRDTLEYFNGEFAADPDEERNDRARRNVDEACRREASLTAP